MTKKTKYRRPVHPGRILKEDLLTPLNQIVRGTRAVTTGTSRRGPYFGFTPDFWLRLQMHYDFELARRSSFAKIHKEVQPRKAA